MNLLEAARSGKRFRKSKGPWIECNAVSVPAGEFSVKMPTGKVSQAYFYRDDFLSDEWEIEEEKRDPTPIERALMGLEIVKQAIRDLGEAKAG